ncbi:Chondroadherin-like protein [Holothuria leucospilota]|uniref:Chondroadherin-like protein n=1 Tax=Holothuria leucospilota TaxID=206669 RepID=A0A9Q1H354_HOLLE|nr:Chondroadherin-like protein [Holothuria leucospilota]
MKAVKLLQLIVILVVKVFRQSATTGTIHQLDNALVTDEAGLASSFIQHENLKRVSDCGQVCVYDFSVNKALCDSRNMRQVPHPCGCENARVLELQENNIMLLLSGNFSGFKHVRILNISDNIILKIQPETFAGMSNLKYLMLNNNQLMELQNETFRGTEKSLRRIDLNNNEIIYIEEGAFEGLHKLCTLQLCHNKVKSLSPTVFQGLPMLRHLMICENEIQDLNCNIFNGLRRLETLDLKGNNLQYIHHKLFYGLKSLTTVLLNGNKLIRMPYPENLFDVRQLKLLDFRNNAINESNCVLPYLRISRILRLGGNPFSCDCDFLILQEWYRNRCLAENLDSRLKCEFNGSFIHINQSWRVNCQYAEMEDIVDESVPATSVLSPHTSELTSEREASTKAVKHVSTENNGTNYSRRVFIYLSDLGNSLYLMLSQVSTVVRIIVLIVSCIFIFILLICWKSLKWNHVAKKDNKDFV